MHTPGEWQVGIAGNCNIVSFDGDDIVGVAYVPSPRNKKLIAAAPMLLEALEALYDHACESSQKAPAQLWEQARAAIAAATKEG